MGNGTSIWLPCVSKARVLFKGKFLENASRTKLFYSGNDWMVETISVSSKNSPSFVALNPFDWNVCWTRLFSMFWGNGFVLSQHFISLFWIFSVVVEFDKNLSWWCKYDHWNRIVNLQSKKWNLLNLCQSVVHLKKAPKIQHTVIRNEELSKNVFFCMQNMLLCVIVWRC